MNIEMPAEAERIADAARALVAEQIGHPIIPTLCRLYELTPAKSVQAIRLANRLRAEGGAQ